MTRFAFSLLPLLAIGLFGCPSGDDGDDGQPPKDAGVRDTGPMDSGSVDSGPIDDGQRPIPGGGTTGGAIDGRMTIFVIDSEDSPIEGATVRLDAEEAVTDDRGRVDFDVATGPVAVHVFADTYVYESVLGLDAQALTLPLQPRDPDAAPPVTTARVTGDVVGFDILPALTTTTSLQVGIVSPISNRGFGEEIELMQADRPGVQDVATNAAIADALGGQLENYEIVVDAEGTTGLLITAGVLELGPGGQSLDLTHVGLVAPLDLTAGSTLAGQTMVITAPLSERVDVTLLGLPSLPQKAVAARLEIPTGGAITVNNFMGVSATGTTAVTLPPRTGPFAGATLGLVALASDGVSQSFRLVTGQTAPSITIDDFLAPPSGISVRTREITVGSFASASFHSIEMTRAGRTAWNLTLVGVPPGAVDLPEVPAGLTDPAIGTVTLGVSSIDVGPLQFGELRFEDLPDAGRFAVTELDVFF